MEEVLGTLCAQHPTIAVRFTEQLSEATSPLGSRSPRDPSVPELARGPERRRVANRRAVGAFYGPDGEWQPFKRPWRVWALQGPRTPDMHTCWVVELAPPPRFLAWKGQEH